MKSKRALPWLGTPMKSVFLGLSDQVPPFNFHVKFLLEAASDYRTLKWPKLWPGHLFGLFIAADKKSG